MLHINNIHLEIQGDTLLTVDQLKVKPGTTIGLIGENGSGKTTLLNYIYTHKLELTNETVTLIPQLKQMDTTKSGGEVTKQYLNDALSTTSGVLLLDEPTTHLDDINTEWLIHTLKAYKAMKIIASHDRDFLDTICDEIWAVENNTIKTYTGNYSKYREVKNHNLKREQDEYKKYQQEKNRLESAVENKRRQAERANRVYDQAQGKYITKETPYFNKMQKRLDQVRKGVESRLNQLDVKEKPYEDKEIVFHRNNIQSYGKKTIIRIEREDIYTGKNALLTDVSFYIKSTEKIALNGRNGSGKTTFLNYLHDAYQNTALHIGFFHQKLESLDVNLNVIDNIMSTSNYDETMVRTMLARLRIRKDDIYKKVGVLSGGERVKVQMIKLLTMDYPVLFLDEPTNFLDIHTIEALEHLLTAYPGTIILVSHDIRFREQITERTFILKEGRLKEDIIISERDTSTETLMILENKISEVIGKLSISPTPELEREFDALLQKKKNLQQTNHD